MMLAFAIKNNFDQEISRMFMVTLRCREAYQTIPEELRAVFRRWINVARKVEGGKDIVRNILSERYLDSTVFTRFLTSIATHFNNHDVVEAYKNACKELVVANRTSGERSSTIYCNGPRSRERSEILVHRVTQLNKVKAMITDAMTYPYSQINQAWQDFLSLDEEEKYQILRDVIPCQSWISWVYFNQDETDIDPLAGKHLENCLAQLGMPYKGYFSGRRLLDPDDLDSEHDLGFWRIHYRFRNNSRHIPTIADTFRSDDKSWNPNFQPSEDPSWGWTRPLGKRRGSRGLPEAVHGKWDAEQWSAEQSLVYPIEFLKSGNQ